MIKKILLALILLSVSVNAQQFSAVQCDQVVGFTTGNTSTTSTVVSNIAGQTIYVCSYVMELLGAATPQSVTLQTGANPSCATPVSRTQAFAGSTTAGSKTVITEAAPRYTALFQSAVAGQLCVQTFGTSGGSIIQIRYAQR